MQNKIEPDSPVFDVVAAVDDIFTALDFDESVFRNPSYNSDAVERVCGLTHTYLQPLRIGCKAVIGSASFYYGVKIHLLPQAYEVVDFESVSEIDAFFQDRIQKSRTEYLSIHLDGNRLDIDIKNGHILNFQKIGFGKELGHIEKGAPFYMKDLKNIIAYLSRS